MEKTPSCKDIRILADEYIEGELTDAQMRDIETHVAECEECRKEFEELRALKEAICSAKAEIPDELHSRIINAIPAKKQKTRKIFYRIAAVSAACLVFCLSIGVFLATMPFTNQGGEVPPDPMYAQTDKATIEECNTTPQNAGGSSTPTDENIEPEKTNAAVEMPSTEAPSVAETAEETKTVAEEMPAPDSPVDTEAPSVAEKTSAPETDAKPETVAAETSKSNNKDGINYSEAESSPGSIEIMFPSPEAADAPGADDITLAILIVSGLLAVASFVAFLISLSSIRNSPGKKENEGKE